MYSDHCQHLSSCALTPPLIQQQSTDNKLGFNLVKGGRCIVASALTLIHLQCTYFVISALNFVLKSRCSICGLR